MLYSIISLKANYLSYSNTEALPIKTVLLSRIHQTRR